MPSDPKSREKLALLAHDLRTPLSAMRITAELIGQGELSAKQGEYLEVLLRSIDALSDMAGELIQAAGPGTQEEQDSKDATAILRDLVELYRHVAEGKNLEFEASLPEQEAWIAADKAIPLRRAVTALIDNAVKYTSTGYVRVVMSADEVADGGGPVLNISVSDSGPGIDIEEQKRLFNPFVRGKTGREAGEGSGLGLWGAAQLVKGLGGKLRLISPKTGGSRFEVMIPVDAGAAAAGTDQAPDSDVAPENGLRGHVLIVDDNETNRRLLSALLESFGVTCDQAESGSQAIEMVKAASFDAVLLDLHMPGMSGLNVSGKLKEIRPGEGLPMIAVTAAMESIGDKRLRDAGFLEVLSKPLSAVHLFEALEHAFAARHGDPMPDAPVTV